MTNHFLTNFYSKCFQLLKDSLQCNQIRKIITSLFDLANYFAWFFFCCYIYNTIYMLQVQS